LEYDGIKMTADLINFRKARKTRERAEAEQQAGENRARFGRTKAEKSKEKAEAESAAQRLDAHRLDDE
jgi:hypothetical protein